MPRGKGHSFADLILQEDDQEDDPETAALAKELAELERKRAELKGTAQPSAEIAPKEDVISKPNSGSRTTLETQAPTKGYSGSRPPLAPSGGSRPTSSAGSSRLAVAETSDSIEQSSAASDKVGNIAPNHQSKSVADRILGLDSVADEAEAEFARMEEELQQQLRDFQAQRGGAPTPANKDENEAKAMVDQSQPNGDLNGTMASTGMSSFKPQSSTGMSSFKPQSSAGMSNTKPPPMDSKVDEPFTDSHGGEGPESPGMLAAQELAKLRAQMEIIENAFPDESPQETKETVKTEEPKTEEQENKSNDFLGNSLEVAEEAAKKSKSDARTYREDAELRGMREELESLDNKLSAIKKQQELKLDERKNKAAIPVAEGREDMVVKLQKQNSYLRERFGYDGSTGKYANPRGVLNLDASQINTGST